TTFLGCLRMVDILAKMPHIRYLEVWSHADGLMAEVVDGDLRITTAQIPAIYPEIKPYLLKGHLDKLKILSYHHVRITATEVNEIISSNPGLFEISVHLWWLGRT